MKPSTPRNRQWLAAGVLLALVTLVAGCSGGGDSSGGDSGAGDMSAVTDRDGAGGNADDGVASPEQAADKGAPPGANRASVQTRAVIETGHVSVTNKDLDATRQEVDRLLAAFGGHVDTEQTTHDREGNIEHATLVLRVPAARFDAAMDAAEKLGTMKASKRSSRDVTTQVIDVDTRVATTRASIARLQKFLTESANIDDLVRLEREITARESELQSLEAQQTYLRDQTAMATLTLDLATPRTYVEPPGALDEAGFLAGLRSGWNGLLSFLIIAVTVFGAALPIVGALAVVGVPLWLLLRTFARNRAAVIRQSAPDTPPDAG